MSKRGQNTCPNVHTNADTIAMETTNNSNQGSEAGHMNSSSSVQNTPDIRVEATDERCISGDKDHTTEMLICENELFHQKPLREGESEPKKAHVCESDGVDEMNSVAEVEKNVSDPKCSVSKTLFVQRVCERVNYSENSGLVQTCEGVSSSDSKTNSSVSTEVSSISHESDAGDQSLQESNYGCASAQIEDQAFQCHIRSYSSIPKGSVKTHLLSDKHLFNKIADRINEHGDDTSKPFSSTGNESVKNHAVQTVLSSSLNLTSGADSNEQTSREVLNTATAGAPKQIPEKMTAEMDAQKVPLAIYNGFTNPEVDIAPNENSAMQSNALRDEHQRCSSPIFAYTCCVCRSFSSDMIVEVEQHWNGSHYSSHDYTEVKNGEMTDVDNGQTVITEQCSPTGITIDTMLSNFAENTSQQLLEQNDEDIVLPDENIRCNLCELCVKTPKELRGHTGLAEHKARVVLLRYLRELQGRFSKNANWTYACKLCKFCYSNKMALLHHIGTEDHLAEELKHRVSRFTEGDQYGDHVDDALWAYYAVCINGLDVNNQDIHREIESSKEDLQNEPQTTEHDNSGRAKGMVNYEMAKSSDSAIKELPATSNEVNADVPKNVNVLEIADSRPYKCEGCGVAYAHPQVLQIHLGSEMHLSNTRSARKVPTGDQSDPESVDVKQSAEAKTLSNKRSFACAFEVEDARICQRMVRSSSAVQKELLEEWGLDLVLHHSENQRKTELVIQDAEREVRTSNYYGKVTEPSKRSRFVCVVCQKRFSSNLILKVHEEEVHKLLLSDDVLKGFVGKFTREFRKKRRVDSSYLLKSETAEGILVNHDQRREAKPLQLRANVPQTISDRSELPLPELEDGGHRPGVGNDVTKHVTLQSNEEERMVKPTHTSILQKLVQQQPIYKRNNSWSLERERASQLSVSRAQPNIEASVCPSLWSAYVGASVGSGPDALSAMQAMQLQYQLQQLSALSGSLESKVQYPSVMPVLAEQQLQVTTLQQGTSASGPSENTAREHNSIIGTDELSNNISIQQQTVLKAYFDVDPKPSKGQMEGLAICCGLHPEIVAQWFERHFRKEHKLITRTIAGQKEESVIPNVIVEDTVCSQAEELKTVTKPNIQFKGANRVRATAAVETSDSDLLMSHSPSSASSDNGSEAEAEGEREVGERGYPNRLSNHQIKELQQAFNKDACIKDSELVKLAGRLKLPARIVMKWFQNARQKTRKCSSELSVGVPKRGSEVDIKCSKCKAMFTSFTELLCHQTKLCRRMISASIGMQRSQKMTCSKDTERDKDLLQSVRFNDWEGQEKMHSTSQTTFEANHSQLPSLSNQNGTTNLLVTVQSQLTNGKAQAMRVRTHIGAQAQEYLHSQYIKNPCPAREAVEKIARHIGINKRVVQVWFQNARAREKKGYKNEYQNIPKGMPASNAETIGFAMKDGADNINSRALISQQMQIYVEALLTTPHTTLSSMTSGSVDPILGVPGMIYQPGVYLQKLCTGHDEAPLDLSKPKKSVSHQSKGDRKTSTLSASINYSKLDEILRSNSVTITPVYSTGAQPEKSTLEPLAKSNRKEDHNSSSQPPSQPTKPKQCQKRYRTQMSASQVAVLRSVFDAYKMPTMLQCMRLGEKIGLPKRVIQVWFQNSRAKQKKRHMVREHVREMTPPPQRCEYCALLYDEHTKVSEHVLSDSHIANVCGALKKSGVSNDSSSG